MEHMATVKGAAPVVGFNHNVKYGPHVYHVQTEDSGLPHAHYTPHLFVGGNIVASVKSSYQEKAGEPDLPKVARGLMEQQHKTMLKRLVTGEFDELAERFSPPHYALGVLADGTKPASYVNAHPSAPARMASKPAAKPAARPAPPVSKPSAPAPATKPAAPWQAAPPAASPPRAPGAPLPHVTRQPAQPTRPTSPPRMAPVVPAAARPAAAAKNSAPPSFFSDSPVEMPADDLPPLFAEEVIGGQGLHEGVPPFVFTGIEP